MIENDSQFLEQFEALMIKPGAFDHVSHLRLAFLYLEQEGVERAVERMGNGLRTFTESVGAADKYHQTITEALIRLMDARLSNQPAATWQVFLKANPDLVKNAQDVLLQHYSPEQLFCAEARVQFLSPDRTNWEK